MAKVHVLFVCLGNICRSPAAEGVLRSMADENEVYVESCGTATWSVGSLPDARMRRAAEKRGLTLESRAQLFQPEFLEAFDYILASDHRVLRDLQEFAREENKEKIMLMTAFSEAHFGKEVPDPYFDEERGFDLVLDMLEEACRGFLRRMR